MRDEKKVEERMKTYYLLNKEKILERSRKHYISNKEKYKTKTKNRYLNNREEIREQRKELYKKYKGLWFEIIKQRNMDFCSICGFQGGFAAIDFHHVNPKEKEMELSHIMAMKPNEKRIKEIDKCIALCANCHRLLHHMGKTNLIEIGSKNKKEV